MVLRTPRRRISPQAKLKYRAIKNFINRALGNQSLSDIKTCTNETITTEESNYLEQHFEETNKTNNLISNPGRSRNETERPGVEVTQDKPKADLDAEGSLPEYNRFASAQVLYKKSQRDYKRSEDSSEEIQQNCNETLKIDRRESKTNRKMNNRDYPRERNDKDYSRRYKNRRRDDFSLCSTNSYSSVVPEKVDHPNGLNDWQSHNKYLDTFQDTKEIVRKTQKQSARNDQNKSSRRRSSKEKVRVDEDFINDIIKRQYKPVKIFGRIDSELSQFSAPVCRDQEYVLKENIQESRDLCSCGNTPRRPKYACHYDMSDMRSVCDTHLYSNAKQEHSRRTKCTDIYNDSLYYDIVPVKEKPSPKSRRKYAENVLNYTYKYKEVPPSPRTLRPRLNLSAQYKNDYEDYHIQPKLKREHSPSRRKRRQVYRDMLESECSIDAAMVNRSVNAKARSGYNSPKIKINSEESVPQQTHLVLNDEKSQNQPNEDKTDQTLCEIKSILQNFLQEIKKDSVVLDSDKTDSTQQNSVREPKQDASIFYPNFSNNSNVTNSIPQANFHQPSLVPPFINPCCYPVLPICPINCMQNSYMMPSPSTCQTCANTVKESNEELTKKEKDNDNETEALIKEIYKFVAQKSTKEREDCKIKENNVDDNDVKVYTTRSVGSCRRITKHNAKIGTAPLRCYSKSCEAIVSHMATNVNNNETSNYSDTIFTKTSQDVTPTTDSYLSSSTPIKTKENKFKSVLQSFGLMKKKKKDIIEEVSESNSTADIPDRHDKQSPYKQHLTNYMMHRQEYYNAPPNVPNCPRHKPAYDHDYTRYSHIDPRVSSPRHGHDPYRLQHHPYYDDRPPHHYNHLNSPRAYHPPTHPYRSSYDPYYPHVPVCLKEIEVRSTATQSEKKFNLFKKFNNKPPARRFPRRNLDRVNTFSTQTSQSKKLEPTKKGPSFWRTWQEKALEDHYKMDTEKFQKKTLKELQDGDMKIKNAMIKNLFYKRNPFSPNNLIIKTLLGRDKSSYENPPKINTRTSMFI